MEEEMDCVEYRSLTAMWRLELAIFQRPIDFFGDGTNCGTSEQRRALERQFIHHYATCGNCRLLFGGQKPLPGLETICKLALAY